MTTDVIETVKTELVSIGIEKDFAVSTPEVAIEAAEALGTIKGLLERLEKANKDEVEPLREQIVTINSRYVEPRNLLYDAEKTVKTALAKFRADEKAQLEQERKLELEQASRVKANLEENARQVRERAQAKASKLVEAGKQEQAQATLDIAEGKAGAMERTAGLVAAPQKPTAPTKLPGVSMRKKWKAKVTNMKEFVAGLLASPYPLEKYLEVKQAPLDQLAEALQTNMDKQLPGTISWEEDIVAARAK